MSCRFINGSLAWPLCMPCCLLRMVQKPTDTSLKASAWCLKQIKPHS